MTTHMPPAAHWVARYRGCRLSTVSTTSGAFYYVKSPIRFSIWLLGTVGNLAKKNHANFQVSTSCSSQTALIKVTHFRITKDCHRPVLRRSQNFCYGSFLTRGVLKIPCPQIPKKTKNRFRNEPFWRDFGWGWGDESLRAAAMTAALL